MSVCEALHPALERLDSEHLSRFKLNWVTVNMHIFHSTILTDPDVQDYAQICKLKVRYKNLCCAYLAYPHFSHRPSFCTNIPAPKMAYCSPLNSHALT